jgi:hypothetical protein
MNSTRGSTPPNPNLDLPNRSTDLNKTSGIIGTPHEESIAKFNPTKTCPKRRNRRNPTKNNREQHNKALRNHAESSIQVTKVHTRSSLPPDHPTLSQDLTMKLSSWSYGNPKKIGREIGKQMN